MRRVHLHAQEVVPLGRVEEDVFRVVPDALQLFLAARRKLIIGHGQGHPDRNTGCSGANRLDRHTVRGDEAGSDGAGEGEVLLSRREHPRMPAHGRHNVGLVECAGTCHDIAQRLRHDGTEPAESLDGQIGLPATLRSEPLGRREVMERHDRVHAALAEAEALLSVVRQRGPRELALGRLNAAPLHREAVVVEPERGHQVGVLFPAVPRVATVPGRLCAARPRRVLEGPPVVVGVPALNLVGGRRGAPGESGRERPSQSFPSHRRAPPACVGPLSGTVSFPDNDVIFLADD